MANKKAATQTPESRESRGKRFLDEASVAPEKPEIHPQLKFGDEELAVGSYDVWFLEDPREQRFQDKTRDPNPDGSYPIADGWVVKVEVIDVKDFDDAMPGDTRCVMFRAPEEVDGKKQYHGLTQGLLTLAKKHGGLTGVKARLGTRAYKHPRWGMTRGYDVYDLNAGDQAKEATA